MTCILCATDLSMRSTVALQRARMLASAHGSELVVVHVIDSDLPAPVIERRIVEAKEILEPRDSQAKEPPQRVVVEVGDVFSAVPEVAQKVGANLIVAGDHRRSRIRDIFGDTTVERLIRVSGLPVVIARAEVDVRYTTPLIAVESDEATELLEALGTVAPERAKLIAVHAYSAPAAGLMFYAGVNRESIADYTRRFTDRIRSQLAGSLGSAGNPVDIRVVDDVPLAAIERIAASENCDLVVVSSHARRAPARGILGSVSSSLIRSGTRDMLIVPRRLPL